MNLPFEKHEEDLWVCRDVFYRGCARANLTSHNIAEQMDHILLPLHSNNHSDWVLICREIFALGIDVHIRHAHTPPADHSISAPTNQYFKLIKSMQKEWYFPYLKINLL